MYLTDEEKRMLDGEYGYGAQTGMKILVALGKVFDAEKLIPVRSAHVAGTGFKTFGKPGVAWLEDLVEKGAKVRIPTTLNVIGVDRATDLGFPRDLVEWQMRIDNAYEAMGAVPINCCTPYWCGYVPRMGESISWSESSAVVYTNSVLGARDNREGGQSSFASGLTGRTPYYGLHIPENRRGQVLVKILDKPKGYSEYSAVGAYVGKKIVEKIPVLIPPVMRSLRHWARPWPVPAELQCSMRLDIPRKHLHGRRHFREPPMRRSKSPDGRSGKAFRSRLGLRSGKLI